jgi:hypothetical protein
VIIKLNPIIEFILYGISGSPEIMELLYYHYPGKAKVMLFFCPLSEIDFCRS